MPHHPTKHWLGGLMHLLAVQREHAQKLVQRKNLAVKRPAASGLMQKDRKRAIEESACARSESRVRPKVSAWANGAWSRAVHTSSPRPLPYGLYIPRTPSGAARALVVMLHGCKQTIEDFASGTRMNLLADRFGFALLYPEQTRQAHIHRCWRWYDDRPVAGGAEAKAVISLIDALVAKHRFDAQRVYIAGLSAGAGLASLLAVHYPEHFAAVALHSGPVFGDAHSSVGAMDVMRRGTCENPAALIDRAINQAAYPGMPAILLHGDSDRVVTPKNAEQLALEFARLNGFIDTSGVNLIAGDVHETRNRNGLVRDYIKNGQCLIKLYRVAGLGHAWAGGDDTVPFHSAQGPDASLLFWEFFKLHHRVAPAPTTTDAADVDQR